MSGVRVRGTSRGNRLKALVAVFVMLLMGVIASPPGPLLAQTQAVRTLTGTVRDRDHEPLRGAVVLVEDESTHSVMSYLTDRSGRYSFRRLRTDTDYTVWSTYRGGRSKKKTLSLFSSDASPVIDLAIKLR